MLRWDRDEDMWVARKLPSLNESLAGKRIGPEYVGHNGVTRRFGRAMTLRTRPDNEYDKTRKELGHHGPYLPILLEACQEQELSYEYRDGATSYGAYTFSMAKVLREHRGRGANLSFSAQRARDAKSCVGSNTNRHQTYWAKEYQTAVAVGQTGKEGSGQDPASTAGARATKEAAGPGTARRRATRRLEGDRPSAGTGKARRKTAQIASLHRDPQIALSTTIRPCRMMYALRPRDAALRRV
jgi:hypothetical protein